MLVVCRLPPKIQKKHGLGLLSGRKGVENDVWGKTALGILY